MADKFQYQYVLRLHPRLGVYRYWISIADRKVHMSYFTRSAMKFATYREAYEIWVLNQELVKHIEPKMVTVDILRIRV